MRKKSSVSFMLLAIMTAAWMFTGCGDKGQADTVSQAEEMNRTEQPANSESNEEQKSDVAEEQTTDENAPADESAELSVAVESVDNNSVVGNKIFIESSANGNNDIMVVRVGGDNKVLVTVHFAEDASYVYRTIRNGGADVETREGSFSDIKNGLSLDLTGHYEGDEFYANKVEINNVILD